MLKTKLLKIDEDGERKKLIVCWLKFYGGVGLVSGGSSEVLRWSSKFSGVQRFFVESEFSINCSVGKIGRSVVK